MRVLYLAEFLSTFCAHCSSWVFVNGSSWPGWINTLLWHGHTVLCVFYLVSFFCICSCAKIKMIKRHLIQFYKFDWTRVLFPLFQKKACLHKSVMYCIKCISDTPRSVVLRPAWTSLWSDSEICRLHRIVNLVSCENMTLRQDKWPLDKEDSFGLKAFPNVCKCCLNFQQCWLCVVHKYQWGKFTVLSWTFFFTPS